MAASKKVAAAAVASTTEAEEGGHYFRADDPDREVGRCLAVLPDGRAVVAFPSEPGLVDPDNLRRIPTTAGDVLRVIGALQKQQSQMAELVGQDADKIGASLADVDHDAAARWLSAIEVWVRGMAVPPSEMK